MYSVLLMSVAQNSPLLDQSPMSVAYNSTLLYLIRSIAYVRGLQQYFFDQLPVSLAQNSTLFDLVPMSVAQDCYITFVDQYSIYVAHNSTLFDQFSVFL